MKHASFSLDLEANTSDCNGLVLGGFHAELLAIERIVD